MSNANEPPGKQRNDDVWLGPDIGWASKQCVESMFWLVDPVERDTWIDWEDDE